MQPSVSNLLADLAQMTKRKYQKNKEPLLPLVSELKKTDANNRQINNILGVINSALVEIKGTTGITTRVGSTYSNMVERIKTQLNKQVSKLEQAFKEVESRQIKWLKGIQEEKNTEQQSIIKQIKAIVSSNTKKLKQTLERQKNSLCLETIEIEKDSLKIKILKEKLHNSKVTTDMQECQVMLGEIRCYSDAYHRNDQVEEGDNFKHTVDSFIGQCQEHFDRQVPFVSEQLTSLSQKQGTTAFQQNLFKRYCDWATRLRISLQSAIIKLSSYLKQSFLHLKNKSVLERWQESFKRWQQMLAQLQEILG